MITVDHIRSLSGWCCGSFAVGVVEVTLLLSILIDIAMATLSTYDDFEIRCLNKYFLHHQQSQLMAKQSYRNFVL